MNRIASLVFSFACALGACLLVAFDTAHAAIQYFSVTRGTGDSASYIYSYDTVANTVSAVTSVNWPILNAGSHTGTHASAGKDGSFWIGSSNGSATNDGVMRFVPNSTTTPTAWSLDFAVSMQGQGPFTSGSGTVNPAAAELANGAFILGDTRDNKYAVGTLNPIWSGSGTITATTAVGFSGFTLNSAVTVSATNGLDIAPTIAGSSNRFIVSAYNQDSAVMVYESNGTFVGNLTPNLAGGANGVGTMRAAGQGDIALQVSSNQGLNTTINVSGHDISGSGPFGTAAFSFNFSTGSWVIGSDVDGTEGGLIMVTGIVRTGNDKLSVQFFNTSGIAASPVFELFDYGNTTSADRRPSGIVLNFPPAAPTPEPSTYALLGIGAAALAFARLRAARRRAGIIA